MLAAHSVEVMRQHLAKHFSFDLEERDVVRFVLEELALYERILESPHEINSELVVGVAAQTSKFTNSQSKLSSMGEPVLGQAECSPLLSSVLPLWLAEQKTFSQERRRRAEVVVGDFIAIVGDRPIDQYRKTDGTEFKRLLIRAPANIEKRLPTLGLSHRDLRKAVDRAEVSGLEPQSTSTVNGKLSLLGQFFRWLQNEYDVESNPVSNLAIRAPVDSRSATDIFSAEDLGIFFKEPSLTSQQAWLCLIGLYTGMRLSEIVQLRCEHLVHHPDGFYYLTLPCTLQLKNPQSCRSVPAHRELISMGFAEFAGGVDGALFSSFQGGASGRLHDKASKWFNRKLGRLGLKTGKKNFHSFRHTWEHACSRAGVGGEDGYAKVRLAGEKPPGRRGRYGERWDQERLDEEFLSRLNHELQKISYKELEPAHILSIAGT